MSATTSGGENTSFGSSQSTPSWREQLMCWTARLTGLSTCNFRWHHDFCTRCAAKVYWSQHYKFTDGYSVRVLVQILLTVQNQIDFWGKRERETNDVYAIYSETRILSETQREWIVRAEEKPRDKTKATSFLFFWPFSQFKWSKSSFPGSLMLSWQNTKQIFSLYIFLVFHLNVRISQDFFFLGSWYLSFKLFARLCVLTKNKWQYKPSK